MIHCTTVGNFYLRPSGAVLYQERRTDRDERKTDNIQHKLKGTRYTIYTIAHYLQGNPENPTLSRQYASDFLFQYSW